ncbi:MAG TPA: anti-sigma factor antagonist [Thiothrix sp.]|nr:anti-sigma factor antagonist [Thiothrix sp.]
MQLNIEKTDFLLVTVQENRLDAAFAPQFKKQVKHFIDEGENKIVLDFSQLNFMDSSSLGMLVELLKGIGTQGQLVIMGARDVVANLFKLTRMDTIFKMVDNLDEAKALLK